MDLITDEDIADGLLRPYKVLYVVGSEMLRAAAGPLRKWVAEGGVVYATGGGGLLDEYRSELRGRYEMYGIEGHELVRHGRHVRPRGMLKGMKASDTLTIKAFDGTTGEISLAAYFYRETLEARAEDKVVGSYSSDEGAGVVVNKFGKGRTIFCGGLAGIAYVQAAVTESSEVLPTGFSEEVRELLTVPARWAGVVRPVETSDPLVEAQYFSGPEGDIVVLINWRDRVAEGLVVRFPGKRDIDRVRSLRAAGYFEGHLHEQKKGELEVRDANGVAQVTLDLGICDYLILD